MLNDLEEMAAEDFAKEPAAGIIRRIRENGPITFAEYMALALYGEAGYYVRSQGPWGAGGDYITSLDVSPVFARMLERQAREMWELLGRPSPFHLIEAGAGRGWLGKGILAAARSSSRDFGGALKVALVEKNAGLRCAPGQDDDSVVWLGDISGAGRNVTGCILSNELIDSFPVHRVVMEGGELKEIFTGFDEGAGFFDIPGPPSTPELALYLERAGVALAEGQAAEINLEAGRWTASAGAVLERGFVITIDYGLPARELYSPSMRPIQYGTLHCHYRHTLNDNPYANIGSQDITTHVDFTSLVLSGRSVGLELTGFATQKNFLLGLGVCEELEQAEGFGEEEYGKVKRNRELALLISPGGMGDTFKVLVQHKGVEKPRLSGFSFRDQSRFLQAGS